MLEFDKKSFIFSDKGSFHFSICDANSVSKLSGFVMLHVLPVWLSNSPNFWSFYANECRVKSRLIISCKTFFYQIYRILFRLIVCIFPCRRWCKERSCSPLSNAWGLTDTQSWIRTSDWHPDHGLCPCRSRGRSSSPRPDRFPGRARPWCPAFRAACSAHPSVARSRTACWPRGGVVGRELLAALAVWHIDCRNRA